MTFRHLERADVAAVAIRTGLNFMLGVRLPRQQIFAAPVNFALDFVGMTAVALRRTRENRHVGIQRAQISRLRDANVTRRTFSVVRIRSAFGSLVVVKFQRKTLDDI